MSESVGVREWENEENVRRTLKTAIGDTKIDNEEPISIKNLIKHTKFT